MKLLLTGAWHDAQGYIPRLKAMGHTVLFQQNESDTPAFGYDTVEGVVCNGLFLHHALSDFRSLRYIQLTSAGYDRVPMDEIQRRNITIHNAGGVYSAPMAEFAVCAVLQFYKQSRAFAKSQRQHLWQKQRGLLELSGKTVCIVGCGSVGRECALRFRAFGCRVVGVDLVPDRSELFHEMFPADRLKEAVSQSSIVILCLPLSADTYHMIDKNVIAVMKHGAVLVNIARGGITDTAALVEALQEKRLFAALDVFENEPIAPEHPLWDMDNVILTPHNSFVGDLNVDRLNMLIMENLQNEQRRNHTTC